MRARHVLAAAVLVGSWGPALASIVIAWMFELPELPVPGVFLSASPPVVQSRFDEIGVTVALVYGAVSAVLLVRRPHPVIGVFAVHAIGSGIAAFGVQWGLLGLEQPGLPAWGLLAHAAGWGYVPGTVATMFVPILLVRSRRGRGERAVIASGIALALIAFLAAFVHQAPASSIGPTPRNPFAIAVPAVNAALPVVYGAAAVCAVVVSMAVAAWVVLEWRRTTSRRRARIGWLALGHGFLTVTYLALVLPASDGIPALVWGFGMIAPVVGQIAYPSAALVLALGGRLRGIETPVARVLLGTSLTVAAVTAYLIAAEVLAAVSPLDPVGIGIVSAALVALAVQPARRTIARRIDRLIYGPDGDPAQLLRRLGERVGEFDSGAEGLAGLAHALHGALDVGGVELVADELADPVAVAGELSGHTIAVELRAEGRRIGEIRVRPRSGERVSRGVLRELEGLAGIVATAVRLATASARLGAARAALVAARQDERRVLRRELHDGIGPALAGVGFGLAAVENLRDSDRVAAAELTARLARDLREQLVEVRRLARRVRPERGVFELSVELVELAADFAGSGVDVRVDVPAAWRVPPAAVRPLFFIAAEAVHNAVRHARAGLVRIVLEERVPGELELRVVDDGCGFDPRGAAAGVGLATMREHAVEAGARLSLASGPTGTTVTVVHTLETSA